MSDVIMIMVMLGSHIVTNHLREQLFCRENAEYYSDGLKRWEHRWKKCVELQGDYVEK